MERIIQSNKRCYRIVAYILFAFAPVQTALAFEILSEGAMDSVSAVSSESADQLLNVAGSPAAGLSIEGFDTLPLRPRSEELPISDQSLATDPEEGSLDSVLVEQIEEWADERRATLGSGFEVGFVERLPGTSGSVEGPPGFVFDNGPDEEVVERSNLPSGKEGLEEEDEQEGRVVRIFEEEARALLPSRQIFQRDFEQRFSVNNDPSTFDQTPGAGFVNDLASQNANRLTSIRDEDQPLF